MKRDSVPKGRWGGQLAKLTQAQSSEIIRRGAWRHVP